MPAGNGGDHDVDLPPTSPPTRIRKGNWIDGNVLAPYVGQKLRFLDEQGQVLAETAEPVGSADDLAVFVGSGGNYQALLLKKT